MINVRAITLWILSVTFACALPSYAQTPEVLPHSVPRPSKASISEKNPVHSVVQQLTQEPKPDVKTVTVPEEMAHAASAKMSVDIVNRPLIAGLWRLDIPEHHCSEWYNFKEDGHMLIKSGREWTTGTYQFVLPTLDNNLTTPVLEMTIRYENNEPDCSGEQVDQSGEVQQMYIKADTDYNHMAFCATPTGDQCAVNLTRRLP